MLHTTRAFVIKAIKHGDRSVVLKAYAELLGMRSYMVRVVEEQGWPLLPYNRLTGWKW